MSKDGIPDVTSNSAAFRSSLPVGLSLNRWFSSSCLRSMGYSRKGFSLDWAVTLFLRPLLHPKTESLTVHRQLCLKLHCGTILSDSLAADHRAVVDGSATDWAMSNFNYDVGSYRGIVLPGHRPQFKKRDEIQRALYSLANFVRR